jgi:hypothetical protein
MTLVCDAITHWRSFWAASRLAVVSDRPSVNRGMLLTNPIFFHVVKYEFRPNDSDLLSLFIAVLPFWAS